jgi:fructuronate reductase
MDGTQKIPFRWGGVLGDRLAAGVVPGGVAYGLAAWSEVVRPEAAAGRDVDDPRAAELRAAVVDAGPDDAVAAARRLLALPGLLPDDAGTDPRLVDAVVAQVEELAARV